MPGHEQNRRAGFHTAAVLVLDANGHLRVEQAKRLEGERDSSHDARFARHQSRAGTAVRHDRRNRGEVIERAVLVQRGPHDILEHVLLEWKAQHAASVDCGNGQRRDRPRDTTALAGWLHFHGHSCSASRRPGAWA